MSNHKEENLFYTRCYVQSKICSLMIDERSSNNVASEYMVQKLGLTVKQHPWLDDNYKLRVSRQVKIPIAIGKYEDEILCDVQPMETCHILLGKPWQNERRAILDGHKNRYSFKYKGGKINLVPMLPHEIQQDQLLLKQRQTKFCSTQPLDQAVQTQARPCQPHALQLEPSFPDRSRSQLDLPNRALQPESIKYIIQQHHSTSLLELSNRVQQLDVSARVQLIESSHLASASVRPGVAKEHESFQIPAHIMSRTYKKHLQGANIEPRKQINSAFQVIEQIDSYKICLQVGSDLRTNPFQVGEDDMILGGTRSLERKEHAQLDIMTRFKSRVYDILPKYAQLDIGTRFETRAQPQLGQNCSARLYHSVINSSSTPNHPARPNRPARPPDSVINPSSTSDLPARPPARPPDPSSTSKGPARHPTLDFTNSTS